MSLSDLAAIGSFVSGIAVVFSFVFLAFQIRQSNLNQKSLIQQGRGARSADLLSKLADPYVSELLVRAMKMDLTLTSSEVQSYIRTTGAWFLNYEDTFLQFNAGTIDLSSWESDLAALKFILSDPAGRVTWRMLRGYWGGAYRDFVDSVMDEMKPVLQADYGEQWKVFMREEIAAM